MRRRVRNTLEPDLDNASEGKHPERKRHHSAAPSLFRFSKGAT
jgi:hypothetical protein